MSFGNENFILSLILIFSKLDILSVVYKFSRFFLNYFKYSLNVTKYVAWEKKT